MKIIYAGRDTEKKKALIAQEPNIIILLYDRWDDYDYKTTFPTDCRIANGAVEIGSIKILIEGEKASFEYLDKLIAQGWDGLFPIPKINYISTPASLSFYEQIEGHLELDAAIEVAKTLHDASYLTKIEEHKDALSLVKSQGFKNSLLRERGSTKAYLDGWKLFGKKSIFIGNQIFRFEGVSGEPQSIEIKFVPDSLLPHDINVLIGPNGVGKSRLLLKIVESWLSLDPATDDDIGFTERPNLNQVVVVSYSPFEIFPVDTSDDEDRRDHDVYKYFGLRGRSNEDRNKIILSRAIPKTNAASSLLACLEDDQKYGAITDWSMKIKTMERVLKQAIEFDKVAIAVDASVNADNYFTDMKWLDDPYMDSEIDGDDGKHEVRRYIPIASDRIDELKTSALKQHVYARKGVMFLKDGKSVKLSSGQRLFTYIVINILGAIRRNSLILVDEPELFLHPSLEISFIRMLKSILASYGSKALVATHSLVTVREIPRNCVHVFERSDDGIVLKTPPFETFGSDVQRISSYVFGDKSLSKPYEDWLQQQLEEYGSAAQLIEALGENINEELIIQINAMDQSVW